MQFFAALLRGEIDTIESSPLDYMVHGEHPYEPSAGSGLKNRLESRWSPYLIHRKVFLTESHSPTGRTRHTRARITEKGDVVPGEELPAPHSLIIAQLPPGRGFLSVLFGPLGSRNNGHLSRKFREGDEASGAGIQRPTGRLEHFSIVWGPSMQKPARSDGVFCRHGVRGASIPRATGRLIFRLAPLLRTSKKRSYCVQASAIY